MTTPTGETATPPINEAAGAQPAKSSSTVQRRRIIYVRPFDGAIQPGDLQLISDELSTDLAENGERFTTLSSNTSFDILSVSPPAQKSSAKRCTSASMPA